EPVAAGLDFLVVDAAADVLPDLGPAVRRDPQERLDDARVELPARPVQDLLARALVRQAAAGRPGGRHRGVGVRDGEDARAEGDLLAAQPARVAGSVEPLLMADHDVARLL